MIDNYLLEQLVAVYEQGTLSAAAEELLVSQPALSRSMKKLEAELEVSLFERSRNKLTLTETGKLAAQEARKVLAAQKKFIRTVQDFAQSKETITVQSVAPGPLTLLASDQQFEISQDLLAESEIEDSLLSRSVKLVFSAQPLDTEELQSVYLGSEDLRVNIDRMTTSLTGEELSFSAIDKLSFVTMDNLGIWQDIIEAEMPEAKFISQSNPDHFAEILSHSSFPFFTTNLVMTEELQAHINKRYQSFYLTDEKAMLDFYAVFRREDERQLAPAISKIKSLWQKRG
ncbi:LysR family transcriptional regulator [Streptococcus loxodontisalivarius]|uniref:DNA-binding transcriptional LysR family regulator n=1 Tax=Streptococcus loxodontisalivarius TaxID=1349415 RepID=A0ABS2PSJ8_9STRE|nr:LysR family transcriptional regulator [Streptococcus loxodontisalivarius]MBM7642685.1 DNA-binding transcriptional LysR family regulator [Streptococcus loxodontisalivarius]